MSDASDQLRAFGDMIDAGMASKIKEPEPKSWEPITPTEPPPGHQFHFQVCIQGQHRVGDGPRIDEPEPTEYTPFRLTVRASSLTEACRKAADTPLHKWEHEGNDV